MALVIDGSGATGVSTGVASVSATITTLNPNDIIVAYVFCEKPSGAAVTVSSVSGGGLTWARRKQFPWGSAPTNDIEIWWAAASSALTAQTITATLTGTVDNASLHLIAVSGVGSLTSPWDSNGSLPATATPVAANPTVTVSTTGASTMALGFWGASTTGAPTPGTGFTALYSTSTSTGTLFTRTNSQREIFSSAQTGIAVGWTISSGNVTGGGMLFDALSGLLPIVDLAGNLGGVSSYGKLAYGVKLYSRVQAFEPVLSAALTVSIGRVLSGDLAPSVSFGGSLGVAQGVSGGFAPIVTFAADLTRIGFVDFGGGLAPQIALGSSLAVDVSLTALEGGLTANAALEALSFISGPLWAGSEPCPAAPWTETELCPPPAWTLSDPCGPVEWKHSELCNG